MELELKVLFLFSLRCPVVWLGVVASACMHSQPGFIDLELERVIIILMLGRDLFEGEDIKGLRIRGTVVYLADDVIACGEDPATASRDENLKRQIGRHHFFRARNSL